jgi:hypothetical protein
MSLLKSGSQNQPASSAQVLQDVVELQVALEKAQKTISELAKRLSKLEGDFASSWVTYTKAEYEEEFKSKCKQDIRNFVYKFLVGITLTLAGVGYFYVRHIVGEVYESKNNEVIAGLQLKYDKQASLDKDRFEWQRNHNFGTNFIHLAEFYTHVKDGAIDASEKQKALAEVFTKAEQYFQYALRDDMNQGSTYWELGQLHYSYPVKYGFSAFFDKDLAVSNYEEAIKHYNQDEIGKGWRADSYKMLGKIYLENSQATVTANQKIEILNKAEEALRKAKADYQSSIPESRKENKPNFDEVDKLLADVTRLKQTNAR